MKPMIDKTKNLRIEWLDATKGIGILLVMLSHICTLSIWTAAGYMPLFFLAAGLTYKPRPFKETIKIRAKRLLIPYFFYSMFLLICDALISIVKDSFDIQQNIIGLFGVIYAKFTIDYPLTHNSVQLLRSNAPMWFLPCMFIAYVYTSLYSNHNRKQFTILASVIVLFAVQNIPYLLPWSMDIAIMAFLFIILSNKHKMLITNMLSTPPYNRYIATGKSVSKEYLEKIISSASNIAVIVSLALIYYFLTSLNGGLNMSVRNYGHLGLLSLPLFYIIGYLYFIIIAKATYIIEGTVLSRILVYVGRQSIRLMCIHFFIAQYSMNILHKISIFDRQWEYIIITISIGIVLFINFCIDVLLNRVKNKVTIAKYL